MAWRPGHLSRMQLEERRLHFAQTYLTGKYNHQQLCDFYGISPSTLFLWKRRLRQYGLSGLKARKPPGRPRILSAQQQAQLQTWVQEVATEHGFADPTWTVPR
ncbi:helix-turn-helix domain-containing protein, partial [Deinococcus misasensis]